MIALCRKCLLHRLLLASFVCGVLLCLSLSHFLDWWLPRQMPSKKQPVNDLEFDNIYYLTQNPENDIDHHYWETEYDDRVRRIHNACKQNTTFTMKRHRKIASNRHLGNVKYCRTYVCPVISDDRKLFFCFIPKVASTHIKRFFLNISDISLNDSLKKDNDALHITANDGLRRVSLAYYPTTQLNRFYKIMFVRHPFDRLVSAFRSKAEQPKSNTSYFYSAYWKSIMEKLRPEGSKLDRVTFNEFVLYLTQTEVREYDVHWAPFWSRCDPCFIDYDFIGKLETARHDFPYAFRKAGIEFSHDWWNNYPATNRSVTLQYFASIPEEIIRKLYVIYKPDFELFGYSVHQFLSQNITDS